MTNVQTYKHYVYAAVAVVLDMLGYTIQKNIYIAPLENEPGS